MISTLVSGPAVALRKTKNAINAATLRNWRPRWSGRSRASWCCIESHDFREGTRAFQQRRAANFTDS